VRVVRMEEMGKHVFWPENLKVTYGMTAHRWIQPERSDGIRFT